MTCWGRLGGTRVVLGWCGWLWRGGRGRFRRMVSWGVICGAVWWRTVRQPGKVWALSVSLTANAAESRKTKDDVRRAVTPPTRPAPPPPVPRLRSAVKWSSQQLYTVTLRLTIGALYRVCTVSTLGTSLQTTLLAAVGVACTVRLG